MEKYITRDREAGNVIDEFATLEEAEAAVKKYEAEDEAQGTFEPDFYEIVVEGKEYAQHHCIEVHHQYGVKVFECEKFWDAAIDEIDDIEYRNMADAVEMWGSEEEVPAELADLLKSGPVIEVSVDDNAPQYFLAGDFDKETFARDVLGRDLNRLIVINSEEEARKIAENYKDHEWVKVRAAALEIIESNRGL